MTQVEKEAIVKAARAAYETSYDKMDAAFRAALKDREATRGLHDEWCEALELRVTERTWRNKGETQQRRMK